jgi:hypothetical protein
LGVTASVIASGALMLPADADVPLAKRVERLEQHVETLKAL